MPRSIRDHESPCNQKSTPSAQCPHQPQFLSHRHQSSSSSIFIIRPMLELVFHEDAVPVRGTGFDGFGIVPGLTKFTGMEDRRRPRCDILGSFSANTRIPISAPKLAVRLSSDPSLCESLLGLPVGTFVDSCVGASEIGLCLGEAR